MKQFTTAITVLFTLVAFTCFVLLPLADASEKLELESKVDAFLKVSDYDRAFKLVDDFLQQQPDVPIGYAMLERVITAGGASLKADDRKRAEKWIDDFIQRYPEKPTGRAMMARVLAADGKTEDAFTEYARFYKLSETISPDLLMEIVRGAFKDSSDYARYEAVVTAAKLGNKDIVPALIIAFNETISPGSIGSYRYLSSIANALVASGERRATLALTRAIEHFLPEDTLMRNDVIKALAKSSDMAAIYPLMTVLERANEEEIFNVIDAIDALGEFGHSFAVPALEKVFLESEGYRRVRTALALAKSGEEYAIMALIDMLNDDSNEEQFSSQNDDRIGGLNFESLFDTTASTANSDASENERLQNEQTRPDIELDTDGLPELSKIDDSSEVQWQAALALAELGDVRGVAALIKALNNNNILSSRVGHDVWIQLGQKGDKQAIPYLVDILNSRSNSGRFDAAVVLVELGDKRGVPALINILNSNSVYGVDAAVTLAKLGNEHGVPALMSVLEDFQRDELGRGEGRVIRVAKVLAKLGDKRGVPYVMDILSKDDIITERKGAVMALGEMEDMRAVPTLVEILNGDDSIELKFSAAEALVKLTR